MLVEDIEEEEIKRSRSRRKESENMDYLLMCIGSAAALLVTMIIIFLLMSEADMRFQVSDNARRRLLRQLKNPVKVVNVETTLTTSNILNFDEFFKTTTDSNFVTNTPQDNLNNSEETVTNISNYSTPIETHIKVLPVSRVVKAIHREGFSAARRICRTKLNGNISIAENENDLDKIYKAIQLSELPATMMTSIAFLGLRYRLNDWLSRDGTLRIYNGIVSSLWHKDYSDIRIVDEMGCSIVSEAANGERLFLPCGCNDEISCYVCQSRDQEGESRGYNASYKLFIEPTTPDLAEENCREIEASLAIPSSFLMLQTLLEEIDENDVNKTCKNVTIGFVRDHPLEDIHGNSVNITMDPLTEEGSRLGDACLGFDFATSQYFTRTSCTEHHGVICTF